MNYLEYMIKPLSPEEEQHDDKETLLRSLLPLCYKIANSKGDFSIPIEDRMQAAILGALEGVASYGRFKGAKKRPRLTSWVYKGIIGEVITQNRKYKPINITRIGRDHQRHLTKGSHHVNACINPVVVALEEALNAASRHNVVAEASQIELEDDLYTELERLPYKMGGVLQERYGVCGAKETPTKEVAAKFGFTFSTTEVYLSRGRQYLRETILVDHV